MRFDDDLDRPIWGVASIAEVLNRSERATYNLLERKLVDADRVGRRWATTKRRLLRQFAGEPVAPRTTS